jgi:hypothetical protein
MSQFMTVLFGALVVLPLCSGASTFYLWRLFHQSRPRSLLAGLLAADATVGFIAGGYLGALTVNTRFLGNTNPPELVPFTLLALVSVLVMPNIIAFMLWQSRNSE